MLNEIKIMGIPFKIVEKAVVCKGESGITRGAVDFSNDTIEIDEELSAERKEQVIIHEVIHAIFITKYGNFKHIRILYRCGYCYMLNQNH